MFLFFFRFYLYRSTWKRVWMNWKICSSSISDCAIQWISPRKIFHKQTAVVVIQEVPPQSPASIAQITIITTTITTTSIAKTQAIAIPTQIARVMLVQFWKWRQRNNQILISPQNHSQVPQRMFKMLRFSHFQTSIKPKTYFSLNNN